MYREVSTYVQRDSYIYDPRLIRHFKRAEKVERVPQTIDKNIYTPKRLQVPGVLFLALRKSPLEYKDMVMLRRKRKRGMCSNAVNDA